MRAVSILFLISVFILSCGKTSGSSDAPSTSSSSPSSAYQCRWSAVFSEKGEESDRREGSFFLNYSNKEAQQLETEERIAQGFFSIVSFSEESFAVSINRSGTDKDGGISIQIDNYEKLDGGSSVTILAAAFYSTDASALALAANSGNHFVKNTLFMVGCSPSKL